MYKWIQEIGRYIVISVGTCWTTQYTIIFCNDKVWIPNFFFNMSLILYQVTMSLFIVSSINENIITYFGFFRIIDHPFKQERALKSLIQLITIYPSISVDISYLYLIAILLGTSCITVSDFQNANLKSRCDYPTS